MHSIASYLNTLPFSYELRNENWCDFAKNIWASHKTLIDHRLYPFNKILELNNNQNIFNTLFNYTNFHAYQELGSTHGKIIGNRRGHAENSFPISTNFCRIDNDTLELIVSCEEGFSKQFVNNLKFYYEDSILQAANKPLEIRSRPNCLENYNNIYKRTKN